eukprot:4013253-Amphidinium_carterae.1
MGKAQYVRIILFGSTQIKAFVQFQVQGATTPLCSLLHDHASTGEGAGLRLHPGLASADH